MKRIVSLLILFLSVSMLNAQDIDMDTLCIPPDVTHIINTFSFTGKMREGIASFYSSNLDGTQTATGEIYRNNKLSAASNDFKLNSWVRVTNLKNNNSVILRINDRMHPKMKRKGRVVDLSRAAARQLDFMKNGLTRVKVETVLKDTPE